MSRILLFIAAFLIKFSSAIIIEFNSETKPDELFNQHDFVVVNYYDSSDKSKEDNDIFK